MKIKKFVVIMAVVAAISGAAIAFTGCGTETVGIYASYTIHNHSDNSNPISYEYKAELFSDGTYELEYETFWAIPVVTLVYGRDITSYGKYSDVTPEDAEEGIKVYKLELPTRIQMICEERGSVTVNVDTANWPQGDEENEVAAGIIYTLNARAETESWENVDDFITAYGRAYTLTCDTTKGTMTVEVDGTQIPGDGAVKLETAAE